MPLMAAFCLAAFGGDAAQSWRAACWEPAARIISTALSQREAWDHLDDLNGLRGGLAHRDARRDELADRVPMLESRRPVRCPFRERAAWPRFPAYWTMVAVDTAPACLLRWVCSAWTSPSTI